MNPKTISAVAGLVLMVGVLGYFWGVSRTQNVVISQLGATSSTYTTALNQLALYNWQVDAVESVQSIKNAVWDRTYTATWNPGTISSTTVATTSVVVVAAVGDFCQAGLTTATSVNAGSVSLGCFVNAANSAVARINLEGGGNATEDPASGTLYVRVVPFATSTIDIQITTSTSPQNP